MTDRVVTLEIPEELALNAEQLGLLSRDRVIAWLQTEVRRRASVIGNAPADPLPDSLMFKGDPEFDKAVEEARGLLAELPPIDEIEGIDIDNGAKPTRREVEIALRESLAYVASGEHPLRRLGRFEGQIWMSDNFNDELPDEEWGDLFQ